MGGGFGSDGGGDDREFLDLFESLMTLGRFTTLKPNLEPLERG